MYGETGRLATRAEHPLGEDRVRVKARQLDWLTAGTGGTWSVVVIEALRAEDNGDGDGALFDRRWTAAHLRALATE